MKQPTDIPINLRDVAHHNPKLRRGFLFRSAALCCYPDVHERIEMLGIKTIIDLRAEREINEIPYPETILSRVNYVNAPMDPWNQPNWFKEKYNTGTNENIAYYFFSHACKETFSTALRSILNGDGSPFLVHCHAGKDRTGIFILLIHLLTENSTHNIYTDYLESRMDSQKEKIDITLSVIEQAGGIVPYLLSCGLSDEEITRLKTFLTNPSDRMQINLSEDGTSFYSGGKLMFGRKYISALKFHDPGLAPVQDETGWYHINSNGLPIYKERYAWAFGYYFNRAAVTDRNGSYHLDEHGNRSYKETYAWVGNYQEGFCVVRDLERNYFHIDLNGDRAYKGTFLYAGDFKEGYACVKTKMGWKHIDREGKDLNGHLFKDLGVFHKRFATARDEKGWCHINKDGVAQYEQRYSAVEPFYNGIALCDDRGTKKVIDENGCEILTI